MEPLAVHSLKRTSTVNKLGTKLENFLLKKIGKAIYDYKMIEPGDRVLVGVSGGKDSVSLLRLLLLKKKQIPFNFDVIPVYVDFGNFPQNLNLLEEYFKTLQLEYHIEKTNLPEKKDQKLSYCFWCSWNRRKILFKLAEKYNCKKIAFAHHLDDIVETFLMNLFYYGEISTMPPKISMFQGKLFIIRPMVYIKEKAIIDYAKEANIPYSSSNCPFFDNSRRKYIENLISELEKKCPYVKLNIFRSMKRIQYEYLV